MQNKFKLSDLANKYNLELIGNGEEIITGLGPLQTANSTQLSFLDNPKYAQYLETTQANTVILSKDYLNQFSGNKLISANPYLTYAQISQLFTTTPIPDQNIHSTAVIGNNCSIHPTAIIGPNCVISDNCTIGQNTRLFANVTLYHDIAIGENCIIHSGAVIGADGFGFAPHNNQWHKIAQIGGVVIQDHVEIGACTTIDRGALDNTIIESGVKLDNHIQIAHNAHIGENTIIAGCVAIAGSTQIGKNCQIGGGTCIGGHLIICDNVIFTGKSMVHKSIHQPGAYSSGTGLQPNRVWQRCVARFHQLDEITKRLKKLEKKASIDA